jgi:hypothetical protein
MENNKNKERGLVLPKSFIQSYLDDLSNEERLEITEVIFNWFLTNETPVIENKLCKVLFNNLLYFLETSKSNYENGSRGGAPAGNQNAKKKTTETTPVVLENNPTCLEEQPPLKNKTTLREEKRKEKKRKEENKVELEENIKITKLEDFDMFSKEAQDAAELEFQRLLNK